jgi:hypothetical protein
MRAFETFRSELLAALRDATRGYGCDSWERAVRTLPRAGAPEWREDWLYAVSGHGNDGMIYQVERELGRAGNTPRSARAWLRVYDLLVGLREELRTAPAVAPVVAIGADPVKVACECVSGCAECDGEGVTFVEPEAA